MKQTTKRTYKLYAKSFIDADGKPTTNMVPTATGSTLVELVANISKVAIDRAKDYPDHKYKATWITDPDAFVIVLEEEQITISKEVTREILN